MKKAIVLLMMVFGFMMATVPSYSQEEAEEVYAFGVVDGVSGTEIIVKEFDYEQENEVNVTYALTDETDFENIEVATDLVKGEEVELFFVDNNGKKEVVWLLKSVNQEE